jgi:hypothetical protein
MRRKRNRWLSPLVLTLVVLAGVLLAVSCATKPEPVEPTPEEPVAVAAPKPEAEYAAAKGLRETVTKFGLDRYDPDTFKKAEASFLEGEQAYGKDNDKAKAAFKKASAGYQKVIDAGFPSLVKERRQKAEDAKDEADDLKSSVAVKADYAAALKLYQQARDAEKAKDYAKCVPLYDQAAEQFTSVAAVARQKKARAEDALLEVEEGLKEAKQVAEEAEQVREEGGL